MTTPRRLTLSVVPGIPLLQPDDDLGAIIIAAITKAELDALRFYFHVVERVAHVLQ